MFIMFCIVYYQVMPIPWREIATSVPLMATLTAHFCYNWGFYTMLTCTPKYMKDVLKYDISSVSNL